MQDEEGGSIYVGEDHEVKLGREPGESNAMAGRSKQADRIRHAEASWKVI